MIPSAYLEKGIDDKGLSFIQKHLKDDPLQLRLKYSSKNDLPYDFLIQQIDARKRLNKKLPTWTSNNQLLFPIKLSMEQASSETTSRYKSELLSGKSIIDMTGGMGIDSCAFSRAFESVDYCDLNEDLCALIAYNTKVLGIHNIDVHCENSVAFLQNSDTKYDWAYIDPARRDEGKRLISLQDCLPNVVEHLPLIINKAKRICIKTSPLLDLKKAISELKYVSSIHILSIQNDCKELLFILDPSEKKSHIEVKTINFTKSEDQFFEGILPDNGSPAFSDPLNYLYEPNASIMKSGMFNQLATNFKLNKLQVNSNVYTSEEWIPSFPGRTFKVLDIHPPFKRKFKGAYLNIITRNFNLKPEEIKKKLKNKDGGARYLIATTLKNNKSVFVLCDRIE